MVAKDRHIFYKFYFAAMWDSFDVTAPGDCISAIKPKVVLRPVFLPAILYLEADDVLEGRFTEM